MTARPDAVVRSMRVAAYRIPTDAPEADGTFKWEATTLVVVQIEAGGKTGLGYTYADASLVQLIEEHFRDLLEGADAFAIGQINERLWASVRNLGRSGLAACAISAVDTALWDLKARLLDMPLVKLLGVRREHLAVYGSGGFTCYDDGRLREQLSQWVQEDGCRWVKMKIGADSLRDAVRVRAARQAIGDAGLFIDANGAHTPRSAIAFAHRIAEQQVGWFEEPVSSDDLAGLRQVLQEKGWLADGSAYCRPETSPAVQSM